MKKVVFMFAFASMLFAACGKEDQEHTTPEEPAEQVPAIVSMMYHLDATDDMLQYLDYTVTYDDGTHTEVIDLGNSKEGLQRFNIKAGIRLYL